MDLVYEEMQRLAEKRLLTSMMLYDSIQAAYTVPEMKQLFKKAGIKKYKIYTRKAGKNFVKEYNVPDAGFRNILGFIETRWIAVIKKE